MDILQVNFFKNSAIYYNNSEIKLPFVKAEGVLYYLLVKKIAYKDELCNLLWSDFSEPLAQKNLRNAVYILRKIFGDKFIINTKKNILQLNQDIKIETDLSFLSPDYSIEDEQDIINLIELYKQDFLEHFNIKSCNNFYDWLLLNQESFKKIYFQKILSAIKVANKLNANNLYENCLLKLIDIEPYEETYYLELMVYWEKTNRKKECIDLYNKLKKILKDDLCIEPQKIISDFIDTLFPYKFIDNKYKNNFYGRYNEKQILRQNFSAFVKNQEYYSCLIMGEPGIGKSRLASDFLNSINDNDYVKLDITCYRVDKDISYKLWDSILEELAAITINKKILLPINLVNNIKGVFPSFEICEDNIIKETTPQFFHQTESMIIQLMEIICKTHKIILYIDNMHWIEESSISLLEAVFIKCRKNLFLIGTSREVENELVEKFYLDLYQSKFIKKINLIRFTLEETKEMIELLDNNHTNQYQLIYKESEGNPFFITEILNNFQSGMDIEFLNQNMANLIGSRLIVLSENAKGILNICSVFQADFNFNMIATISGISNILLADIIDELLSKKFICDFNNAKKDELYYFSHQKIKEFIYYQIPTSKRKILHKRIAEFYENNLNNNLNDRFYYYKIIYHYRKAEDDFKTLKYRVKYLEIVLKFQHELFPTFINSCDEKLYKNTNINTNKFYSTKSIEDEFKRIDDSIKKLHNSIDNEEFAEIEIIYLYLRGRYYERIGDSSRSINLIKNMVTLATEWDKGKYIYEGYIQLILHGINVYDQEYVDSIISIARNIEYIKNNPLCLANIMRHEGDNYVCKGEFTKGEQLLLEALDILLKLNDENNFLNISAVYYCLGESKFKQHKYYDSLNYFKKSIDYYKLGDYIVNPSVIYLGVIYLGIGMNYYYLNDFDKAEKILNQSLKYYEQSIFIWKKATLYCYLSRIALHTDKIALAKEYLDKAWAIYPKYSNKLEKEELMRLQDEINNK